MYYLPLHVVSSPINSSKCAQGLLGDERGATIEELHRQATQAPQLWRNVFVARFWDIIVKREMFLLEDVDEETTASVLSGCIRLNSI